MTERTHSGIEQHPDILALRASSERATTTVTAQVPFALTTGVLGLMAKRRA
ncbi:hypothetical protein AB0D11_48265 [Streptomyces monashensis]|uniref:hypothetical protein n=1 Tax=Streptomyces monashensis TaxID=1678012 RepID=UPI0033FF903A